MKNQVTMRRDLGPKEDGVEYIEFIDDFKKGIIAISAMLNSRRSVTLYFGVNDAGRVVFAVPTKYFSRKTLHVWDYFDTDAYAKKFFLHGLIYHLRDYMIEEIERALSPKVSVKCTIKDLGDWSKIWNDKINATEKWPENALGQTLNLYSKCVNSLGNFGVIKFCVKGEEAPYTAYGQYYEYKDGAIRPLKSGKYVTKTPREIVSIGPKTEQSIYLETFSDLLKGLESASKKVEKYSYVTLYFGVRNDGTVVDPRSSEETAGDLTETRKNAIDWFSRQFISYPKTIFGVEKIGEAHVARVIILQKFYERHITAYSEFHSNKDDIGVYEQLSFLRKIEKHDNRLVCVGPNYFNGFDSRPQRRNIFESPVRDVSFNRVKELLVDKNYTWENFESEFRTALFDKNGRYSLLASLLGDNVDTFLGFHLINLGHVKVEMPKWENPNHCLFDWVNGLFDNFYKANDVWTGMIDEEEVVLQEFDVNEIRNAFLCMMAQNDWTTLHIPIVEITDTSIAIVFRSAESSGWLKKNSIPKENEPLVKLMKNIFAFDNKDISFPRIHKKIKRICISGSSDGYSRVEFPIRVRL